MCRKLPTKVKIIAHVATDAIAPLDYEPANILLHVNSDTEYEVRLHSCAKEPETIEWIESFKAGDVFYDVGANVGAYSLVAAKQHAGAVRVYAFEPSFANFAQLSRNVMLNGLANSVVPLQLALSDVTGLQTFNYQNLEPGGALHTLGAPVDYKGDLFAPIATQQVPSYRIDDLISQLGLPQPTHLKLDVDGIESAILSGAAATLANPALKSILVEIETGDEEAATITATLKTKGLRLRSKHPYVYRNRPEFAGVCNYIYVRDQ
jgi:FkbM family methyltransferase